MLVIHAHNKINGIHIKCYCIFGYFVVYKTLPVYKLLLNIHNIFNGGNADDAHQNLPKQFLPVNQFRRSVMAW